MGIKIEFNILISGKLVREINAESNTLGIKSFEYSADGGIIEFNDNVTQQQVVTKMGQLRDRLVRQVP
jgi:hypothetical protein